MIWLYSQRQFGLAKTDEYVGRFSDIFDILARHEIGTQRLELGENNFSLPIEKHVILFILSDSSITIIPILINHRMWLAIFPRDRILTYKTLKPWPVFLDHYRTQKEAYIYPNSSLGIFRDWLYTTYVNVHLKTYLANKMQQRALPAPQAEKIILALQKPTLPRPN